LSSKKILLLTLKTFSLTGGIEKVCRSIAYALQQLKNKHLLDFNMISFYDDQPEANYIDVKLFSGYKGKRIKSFFYAVKEGIKSDTVILSHINLAPVGLLIKIINPKTELILWTHGIEVWRPINFIKKLFLRKVDQVVAVSNFTAKSLTEWHQVSSSKIKVILNALDPFFKVPRIESSSYLYEKYHIPRSAPIIIALTRLSSSEQNKNYDKVIQLLGELKKEGKPVYYLLGGKYDEREYERIQQLKTQSHLEKEVILSGFVSDEEIIHYYHSAQAFVLPSTKEGFGLVFIEAQACGLQVLAGNQDGSTDAVLNPEAGILVDPTDTELLKQALLQIIENTPTLEQKQAIQTACLNDFSFERFAMDFENLTLREPQGDLREPQGSLREPQGDLREPQGGET
jgi:phosphatidylinositol alpha-1,6-mannosyltransferase